MSLYVDVPLDAIVDTYPVKISVEGHDSDIEKADLVVSAQDHLYDLSLETPKLTPTGFYKGATSKVNVIAPIELTDLKSGGGRYVTTRFYVDGSYMESKQVYIASGQKKDIEFSFDADEKPIYGEVGEYDVYFVASISGEYEKSKKAVLKIKDIGEPSISVNPKTFETEPNGTIEFSAEIHNPGFTSQTYMVYAKGVSLSVTPNSVTVLPEDTLLVTLTGQLENAPIGDINAVIEISNANGEATDEITLTVVEQGTLSGGSSVGGGVTGYLLTTTGGVAAMIVSLLLLVAVVVYYYYSRQDEQVVGDTDDAGSLSEGYVGSGSGGSGAGTVAGQSKLTAGQNKGTAMSLSAGLISKVFKSPSHGSDTMKREQRKGINLERFEDLNRESQTSNPQPQTTEQTEPAWHPKDAEHVLANLEDIKGEFHKTYMSAKELRQKLKGISSSVGEKSQKISTSISDSGNTPVSKPQTELTEPNKSTAEEPTESEKTEASDNYIKSVLDNV